VRSSSFFLNKPGNKQYFKILNSSGEINIIYIDDENQKSNLILELDTSPILANFDAVSNSRKVNILSKDSLGSIITGTNDAIILSPIISSHDKPYFQRITTKTARDKNKVLYGIIDE
jgi:hypothetical protein